MFGQVVRHKRLWLRIVEASFTARAAWVRILQLSFQMVFYMSSLFTKISLANCFKKPHVLEKVVGLLRLLRSVFEDSLPEWSKGVDSSSTSASCVGSNPTAVNLVRPPKTIQEACADRNSSDVHG